jgi:hypothetical protein
VWPCMQKTKEQGSNFCGELFLGQDKWASRVFGLQQSLGKVNPEIKTM